MQGITSLGRAAILPAERRNGRGHVRVPRLPGLNLLDAAEGRVRLSVSPRTLRLHRRLTTVLTGVGIMFGLMLIAGMTWRTDAAVYWMADLDELYDGAREGGYLSYLYSPAFAQALEPLRAVPLDVFVLLSRLTALAAVAYLARWLTLPLLFTTPVAGELLVGNIHLQLALAIVLSFRWPALWAFPLLTKPTLGIGILWYVVRGEWRSAALAIGTTTIIAGVSFVLAPGSWFDWVRTMAVSTGPLDSELARQAIIVPLAYRLAFAAALITWGARTDRRWTIVVGTCIALPTLWIIGLSMLAGLLRTRSVAQPAAAATSDGRTDRAPSS